MKSILDFTAVLIRFLAGIVDPLFLSAEDNKFIKHQVGYVGK